MFGRNRIASRMYHVDGDLIVNSMFLTIQGEGPDAGRPAVFIRLAGCNLRCWFCDTDFEAGRVMDVHKIMHLVRELTERSYCDLVVITGGEPLLQNIIPLVGHLNVQGRSVSVETAGTVSIEGLKYYFAPDRSINGNLIVCSPKTPNINPEVEPLVGAFKYIVRAGRVGPNGIPQESTQFEGKAGRLFFKEPEVPIYLQPCDEYDPEKNAANMKEAVTQCMRWGYHLSVQVHKIAGLP